MCQSCESKQWFDLTREGKLCKALEGKSSVSILKPKVKRFGRNRGDSKKNGCAVGTEVRERLKNIGWAGFEGGNP